MIDAPPKYFRLTPGREVRLRGAYFVTCTGYTTDDTGAVVEVQCTYDPDTRGGNAPDGRKVKGTIHWVSARHALDAGHCVLVYPGSDHDVFRPFRDRHKVVLAGRKGFLKLALQTGARRYLDRALKMAPQLYELEQLARLLAVVSLYQALGGGWSPKTTEGPANAL